MENQTDGSKKVGQEEIGNLVGKILTIYDAAYGSSTMTYTATGTSVGFTQGTPSKEQAIKTLITQAIWDWFKSQ